MNFHSFLAVLFLPTMVFSQFSDDFSDGDFLTDPPWQGTTGDFHITSSSAIPEWHRPALQLNALAAGSSYLATSNRLMNFARWDFWIKLSFNTSANNLARVYLVSDNEDLTGGLHGYFIQFGGPDDSVCFCRQDSLAITYLYVLPGLYCGNSTNALRFMIIRDNTSGWEFYSDPQGGELLQSCGCLNDQIYTETAFFGLFCQYTQSNISKIYFDEVVVSTYQPDTMPPKLLGAEIQGPSSIRLLFDEPLQHQEATDVSNYSVSEDLGAPYSAVQLSDPEQVQLFFNTEMIPEKVYVIRVENLKDLFGNSMGISSLELVYYPLQPFDLIITELMADPEPPMGLPAFEYLELFNRTDHKLQLTGDRLVIGGRAYELQAFSLQAGNFLIITSEEARPYFTSYGTVVSLPYLNLPNEGATISIIDSSGNNLYFMEYNRDYYDDPEKSDGGWSLEIKDIHNPCVGLENWTASASPYGGTPGTVNSVSMPLIHELDIISACSSGEKTIDILFNTIMDSLSLVNCIFYNADKGLGAPVNVLSLAPGNLSVRLEFDHSLVPGELYRLSVSGEIKDCTGLPASSQINAVFGKSESCNPFDVVINEVLFNPVGDGVDFVEILNVSDKVIDVSTINLCSVHDRFPALPDTQKVALSEWCLPLLPDGYLCLTSDPGKLSVQFTCPFKNNLFRVYPFPSLNNDAGTVLLTGQNGIPIDRMDYEEDMHFPLLNTSEGISLEKIVPREPGVRKDNWHSASSFVGFGTPGYENSQYTGVNNRQSGSVVISHEVFSPDGDGRDDVLLITCSFTTPGLSGSVIIFDRQGRLVRVLIDNSIFGLENTFAWDGTSDGNSIVDRGIYVIFTEVIDMGGRTYRYKKAVGLAR